MTIYRLKCPVEPTCFNVWEKKKKKNFRGERASDGKAKPLQALKEPLKSKFPKYGNSVKVVTDSGAQGDEDPDPSVKAISSQ